MENNRRIFGYMPDGTPVEELTLRCGIDLYGENTWTGACVCKVITYGAAIRSLVVPDKDGNPVDVVLGFDTLEDYMAQDKYIGAVVGRYANRIGGARFTLNGVEYPLAANDGENSLHGGNVGFDKQVWTVESLEENGATLSLVSPDGQEGYPGTMKVTVDYILGAGGSLEIRYRAQSDRDTVCNLTNHSYFNLGGHDSGSVEDHQIILLASRYTPARPGSIPTGEIADVAGTPMDLRRRDGGWRDLADLRDAVAQSTPIGAHIGDGFDQLTMAGGYDHNWALDHWMEDPGEYTPSTHPAAYVWCGKTDLLMSVHTGMPGVQFYTGNFLKGCPAGKGGAAYGDRHGFCLETQYFPDSPNRPEFPSCVLRAGETWSSATRFCFHRGLGR